MTKSERQIILGRIKSISTAIGYSQLYWRANKNDKIQRQLLDALCTRLDVLEELAIQLGLREYLDIRDSGFWEGEAMYIKEGAAE